MASATACALLDLECVVYMGTEDMRRQRPNVERMKLLGAEVAPVEAGARTLKEAVSAAIRDWVANVATTHYVIGSAVGPAPYPALVRDLQRVIGDEARAQVLETCGRLPDRVIACVGGGSNAIGTFTAFLGDADVDADRRRGRGGGPAGPAALRAADHRAPAGSCTARCRRCSRTRRARSSRPTRSPPAWTTRARGPSTRSCATRGGCATSGVEDADALAAFRRTAELEGILPALEPAHAIAWLLGQPGSGGIELLTLSGRGDKDLAEVLALSE